MTLTVALQGHYGSFELHAAFQAPVRGITGLLGPSGCGKTTLLRAIAGLDRHARGEVRLGDTIWQATDGHRIPVHQRQLGFVFQQPSLLPHLSVAGNLQYGQRRRGRRAENGKELIELLGLSSLLHRQTETLSGGEQQRVAIGRALLSQPDWLLMDEPLAALDLDARESLLQMLEALHDRLRTPILFVSHQYEEICRLADHLLLMEDGRITASGPLHELSTHPELPLCHRSDAAAILDGHVEHFDANDQLLSISTDAGTLLICGDHAGNRSQVRLRVQARDVSLSQTQAAGSSILNILPARIVSIHDEADGQTCVVLHIGSTRLLARISRRSAMTMSLKAGQSVFAQIKGAALLRQR